ncbi:phage virion morphogenesis protein [Acidimangrovimonas sediminis]|uniref:phage virion morphogenesis protein n=1 Tax=Acidimangrovimonas sediminis TaxID=2056283 RepID=UPI000C8069AE|nr:phage virion morphogenesis protein [Acidimangrovimonas sediminis]
MVVTVELNDADLIKALERAARAVTDMTPLMQEIGEMLVESTKARFPEGVSPEGTPWAPKSQSTIDTYRRREAKGKNASLDFRPLFGPSRMLSSQIHYEAGPNQVEWGSNRIYAAVMQLGAAKGAFGSDAKGHPMPWGDIPAREFLGLSDTDRTNIGAAVNEWLQLRATAGSPDNE